MTRMGRKATVIGGAGFIGRHLVERLLADGWDCHVPDRGVTVFAGDLGHVFYCAGLTGDFETRPFDAVDAHVTVLSHLIQQTQFSALVYLSSTRLYDGLGDTEAAETAALRFEPQRARHLYHLSKALGESLCLRARDNRARVARLSNVYGSAPDDGGGFLADVVRIAAAKHPGRAELEAAEGAGRDYVAIDDVIDAVVAIAERGTKPVYNVASGTTLTNRDLFAAVRRETGADLCGMVDGDVSPSPRIVIDRMVGEFDWRPTQLLDALPGLISAASSESRHEIR